jgi:tetratricopeptide (TPR) repeat protein
MHWRLLVVFVFLVPVLSSGCTRTPEVMSERYLASGDRYASMGRFEEAAIEYRNAIKRMPRAVEAHRKLAQAATRLNDEPTFRRETLQLAELEPGNVGAQLDAGELYLAVGRFDEARGSGERALTIDPRSKDARSLIARALNDSAWQAQLDNRLDAAAGLARDSLAQFETTEALDTLGWIYVRTGRADDATKLLTRAVEARPDKPIYLYHLGVAATKAHQIARARDALVRAISSTRAFEDRDGAIQALRELDGQDTPRR